MTERPTRVNYLELVRSSPEVGEILTTAGEIARQRVHPRITSGDILSALVQDDDSVTHRALADLDVDIEQLKKDIEARQQKGIGQYKEGKVSRRVHKALKTAAGLAEDDHSNIGERHLIAVLLQDGGSEPSLLFEKRLGIAKAFGQRIYTYWQYPV